MSDRVLFVQGLAHKLLEQWPAGVSADDALGLVVSLTELAFPPEPERAPATIPATLTLTPAGGIEGALQLGAGGLNVVELDQAELEEAAAVMEGHGLRHAEALERAAAEAEGGDEDEGDEEAEALIREAEARGIEAEIAAAADAAEDRPAGAPVEGGARRKRQSWDADEDAKLCRFYFQGLRGQALADALGRDSVPSVNTRVSNLKSWGRLVRDVTDHCLTAANGSASSLGGAI